MSSTVIHNTRSSVFASSRMLSANTDTHNAAMSNDSSRAAPKALSNGFACTFFGVLKKGISLVNKPTIIAFAMV